MTQPISAVKHPSLPLWCTKDGSVFGPRGKRKTQIDRYGYERVSYKVSGRHRKVAVHRVVAETFLGVETLTVNHKDGNKRNNCISNLEFVTGSENTTHSFKTFGRGKVCDPVFVNGEFFYSKRECERRTGIRRNSL